MCCLKMDKILMQVAQQEQPTTGNPQEVYCQFDQYASNHAAETTSSLNLSVQDLLTLGLQLQSQSASNMEPHGLSQQLQETAPTVTDPVWSQKQLDITLSHVVSPWLSQQQLGNVSGWVISKFNGTSTPPKKV